MRLLVDECCDAQITRTLRADGHDVLSVLETMLGVVDDVVLRFAWQEQRILITEDRRFCELVFQSTDSWPAVILLNFPEKSRETKLIRLRSVLNDYPERVASAVAILTPNNTRFRLV